ncbi:nuclear transport factor 2 family protein [Gordonia insulae]|uniref:SnoaL-like domain-containing protein n=1 Tax=Gordonia insulae TaxID=2420509 RepID=A0A3G8JLK3_9ACTN|nr:nuclear transport factor 2 family protein [Gordonia insulae]AZG45946.1 hypothetical protein D7316_02546 [Gordonia insulae]
MSESSNADTIYGVHNTIAEYAHALDDGRADDVAALFCIDGISDISAVGRYEGREEIRAGYARLAPTSPQRHLVSNVVVTPLGTGEARASSDFLFLARGDAGWAAVVAGHYDDDLHLDEADGRWRFHRRATSYVM